MTAPRFPVGRLWCRSFFVQAAWNPERMLNLGLTMLMAPAGHVSMQVPQNVQPRDTTYFLIMPPSFPYFPAFCHTDYAEPAGMKMLAPVIVLHYPAINEDI